MIKDDESAFVAIQNIVTQGEGFQGPYVDDDQRQISHYEKFRYVEQHSGTIFIYYYIIIIFFIDLYTVIPVKQNPHTADYHSVRLRKVSELFDAAYCYLLLCIERLWEISDPVERQKITYGSMYNLMMGILAPLAKLLVSQQIK